MDLSGRRLGHIRVERILGQGGMGDVYEGFDEKLARRVALKTLHRDRRLDDEARARLIREARTLSQLEHPNICRIHDYIEGDDADVLVLELIEGRTLQSAIEQGLSRAERLRIAQSVAEVLVAAHRAAILHRDLKPDNVMLTGDGTVKVLDFGLARWIERPSGKRKAVRISRIALDHNQTWHRFEVDQTANIDTPPAATGVGMTVGTPMFMSPEQARGEQLTPASDMYSFGLLLQALFTSADPYPSTASGMEVMTMAARGQSLPVAGVPRDVAALINSLKALAPTDRPTAVETLARLRHLADKPKRLVRRGLLAAALLLIVFSSWKYTIDLRRERAAALAAKQEAMMRRGQAEDLVGFIVGDLRRKLEAVGRLDVLDAAATKAFAYNGSLRPDELGQADLLRNSEILNQLGEVRMGQGRLPEAMSIFRRSLDLSTLARTRVPSDAAAQLAVGTSHYWLGKVFQAQGDLPQALRHQKQYLSAAETVMERHPGDEKYRMELAYGNSMVAQVLEEKGDLREALLHYQTTMEIKRAYADAAPDDGDRRYDLSITLNHVGYVLERLGDLRGARDYYRSEQELLARLVASDPRQTRWMERLAVNHSYMAGNCEAAGDDVEGMAQRRAGLALEGRLHLLDASNTLWTRNLAVTLMLIGEIERRNGQLPAARAAIGESEGLLRGLLKADPSREYWKRTLAIVLVARARSHAAAAEGPAALAVLDESTRLLGNATDLKSRRYAAEAEIVRGDVLRAQGSASGARAAWTRARDIIAPVARGSTEPQLLDTWARSLLRLGETGEAEGLVRQLDRIGYRPRELTRSLPKKIVDGPMTASFQPRGEHDAD